MKLTEHIYSYDEEKDFPLWGMSTSNTTVIKGSSLVMIDPGPAVGPHLKKVRRAMKQDGLCFENIEKIIVTHAHADHAAAIPNMAETLSATVYAHHLEKRILETPALFWKDEFKIASPMFNKTMQIPEQIIKGIFYTALGPQEPFKNVISLNDGHSLDIGIPAQIVELPGHTRGEIGIHLPDDHALITGDLIHWGRYDLPSLNLPTSDIDQAVHSIRRIREMNLEIVVTGHEKAVRGKERIRKWLDAALLRCERMKRITAEEIRENGRKRLFTLGHKLKEKNKDIPLYEQPILALVLIKSVDHSP